MYVSTKDQAKILRATLKQFKGVRFSVTSDIYSIRVSFTRNSVVTKDQVEKLAKVYESIGRCPVSGEILMGGNTFVFVTEIITDEQVAEMYAFFEKNYPNYASWDYYESAAYKREYWDGKLV